jgi:hypothetical protein
MLVHCFFNTKICNHSCFYPVVENWHFSHTFVKTVFVMIVWIYIILKIETLVNSLNLNLKINKYIKLKNKKLDRFLNYIF